ncbi:Down syndrome cell adhesion molecule-like protein Dscam2 [Gryllus bimaculatus]|nr:Down syndrome cell adhesion molecule-like protein Dscam2 [Gryllus bimaculatus]
MAQSRTVFCHPPSSILHPPSSILHPPSSILHPSQVCLETACRKQTQHFEDVDAPLANGTLLLARASDADEGHYLCEAHNGIGAGLSKVVQLTVNVPERFLNTMGLNMEKGCGKGNEEDFRKLN